ncbi:helix-turn-helix domain-containing protein [Roseibacterium beibuensis]|nr:helix-turn-helix domain-containing protein [Roseibacterium beibuensis]
MENAKEIAERLRRARINAGFESAREAAGRFGWAEATYTQHENGSRGIRLPVAEKYAQAFGVPAPWLFYGQGAGIEEGNRPRHGFAEPEVQPITDLPRDRKTMLRQIARAVAPDQPHATYYILNKSRPDLMLARGDLLVLQLGPEAGEGDVVLAQVYDDTGEAETELREVIGDQLVGSRDHPRRTIPLHSNDIQVRGRVLATVRT